MNSLVKKDEEIKALFSDCKTTEDVYSKIIAIGQKALDRSFQWVSEENLVPGCQSLLYLHSEYRDGKLYFKAHSDALISRGLAELLVMYYSGEEPQVILTSPPSFLEDLKIPNSLTPSRANGLYHIHLKMKQKALEVVVANPN